jgi:hypothetical protein
MALGEDDRAAVQAVDLAQIPVVAAAVGALEARPRAAGREEEE